MIKKLPKQFSGVGEVKGFEFTQIEDTPLYSIYSVTHEGVVHYEIFKKRIAPVCLDFKNRIYSDTDSKEIYPKSASFGIWAWSIQNLTNAEPYIKEIITPKENK